MMSWVLIITVLVFGWCLYYEVRRRRYKEERQRKEMNRSAGSLPKGNWGWPFIGETLDFIACGYSSRPVSFMDKRKSLYGEVFKTHILGRPIIVSTDPDVNKAVLQNCGNVFIPCYPKSITELLGKSSILQMNGILQKRLHALIGGFLPSPQLKARITRDIESSVKLALLAWKDPSHCPIIFLQEETKGVSLSLSLHVHITFEVLVRVLMSVGPGEEMNFVKREFEEFIKGLICLPIKLPGTRLYKSLKDGNIVEMMIPGEDSVPMVMTLAVKYLSDSPLALARLVDENMELKRNKVGSCEGYAWTEYMSLAFTQNVISETLRMANIINAVWRKALKDVEIIVKNMFETCYIIRSIALCKHFLRKTGGGSSVNSNTFTPFGGGQRLCPGLELSRLEISIFLHHLVTTYRRVAEEDDIVTFPTVKMKRKLPITIMPIDDELHWIKSWI
ncbi:hypothetical protein RJ639_041832, partial [Escallonia herrerae]